MNDILKKIPDYLKDNRNSALCIVTSVSGSAPGKIGAKMVVFDDGSIEGTVGGGAVEKRIIDDAIFIIREQIPQAKEYNLGEDLSMACGGSVTIYIEPIKKPAKLHIFGAGHIGKYLAQYAPDLGFETSLIDWREDIFDKSEHTRYTRICRPYLEAAADIRSDDNTYFVIVTPGHEMDAEVLSAVGKKPAGYIGLIGSRKKIDTLVKKFLKERILTENELKSIDMPIGIKFNAITPAEISISILAKMIDVRNNKSTGKL